MKIVLVSSRKGGCGKSTITANLAANFAAKGQRTALMDLDPQKSLTYWTSLRQAQQPKLRPCAQEDWLLEASELEDEGVELLLIDSPPIEKKWIKGMMRQVDLILIPTRPSPLDIYSATMSNEWAKRYGTCTRWVLNGAHPSSHLPATIRESLQDVASTCNTVIHQRTDIAISLGEGKSVAEFNPHGRSALEFAELTREVGKLLKLKNHSSK